MRGAVVRVRPDTAPAGCRARLKLASGERTSNDTVSVTGATPCTELDTVTVACLLPGVSP